jgi:hypothetical protein
MKRYILNVIVILGILMAYGMAFIPVQADNGAKVKTSTGDILVSSLKVGDTVKLSTSTTKPPLDATFQGTDAKGNAIWKSIIAAPKYIDNVGNIPINCVWINNGDTWSIG